MWPPLLVADFKHRCLSVKLGSLVAIVFFAIVAIINVGAGYGVIILTWYVDVLVYG